jgi:hypothetical protein
MGAYKGEEARYNIVSSRVTEREFNELVCFAADRKINLTAAVRMLLAIGLETMNSGGADNA